MVGVFIPQKLANNTNEGFLFSSKRQFISIPLPMPYSRQIALLIKKVTLFC